VSLTKGAARKKVGGLYLKAAEETDTAVQKIAAASYFHAVIQIWSILLAVEKQYNGR
jgi:hypothetical protein